MLEQVRWPESEPAAPRHPRSQEPSGSLPRPSEESRALTELFLFLEE